MINYWYKKRFKDPERSCYRIYWSIWSCFSRNCQPYILRLHLYFTIIKKDNILPLGIITWAHPAFNVFLSWKVLMGSQDSSVRSHVWFLSRFTENNAVFNSEKVSPECAVPRFLKLSNNFGISLHFGRVPHN